MGIANVPQYCNSIAFASAVKVLPSSLLFKGVLYAILRLILAEGAMTLPVTLSGGVLFAS